MVSLNDCEMKEWITFDLLHDDKKYTGQIQNFSVGRELMASVQLEQTGMCVLIADSLVNYIEKVELPMTKKTGNARAKEVPNHYQGTSEIDLIEFFYQQWGLEALKAVTSFNIQRYALRLGRKDDETNELRKVIQYAQRYIEKVEAQND